MVEPCKTCTECGAYYNLRTGDGTSSFSVKQLKVTRIVRRLRMISLLAAAVLVVVCVGVIEWYKRISGIGTTPPSLWDSRVLRVGGFAAVVLLVAALTSYLYERDGQ